MLILGIDVATKSMGIALLKYDVDWEKKIQTVFVENNKKSETFEEASRKTIKICDEVVNILNNTLQILFLDVVDLIPKQKMKGVDVFLVARRLKKYLNDLEKKIDEQCQVLLEYQMGPNDKSRGVCAQLVYHFAGLDSGYDSYNIKEKKEKKEKEKHKNKYTVEIVGPSLKNKHDLDKEKTLAFFRNKYVKSYDANKKHSIHNLKTWLDTFGKGDMFKKYKAKHRDDVADAFNMCIAWLAKNNDNYITSNSLNG